MLHLTGTSELRGKESKRLDLVQMCTKVGCNFSEHPFLGKRYPCPSVLRNAEIKRHVKHSPEPVQPRLKSYQVVRFCTSLSLSVRAIVSTLGRGVGRGKGLQATCVSLFFLQATCSANLNSLIGIVYAPCFVFRNENCPGGPGGKSGSPPGAKLWAPNPRPVEDRGLVVFVGNQKLVWLREKFVFQVAQPLKTY